VHLVVSSPNPSVFFSASEVGVKTGERRGMSWWLVTVTMHVVLPAWPVTQSCESWKQGAQKGPNLSDADQ